VGVVRYPYLGRSALRVSRLALGGFNLGIGVTDEATAHRILDEALDAGINLVDTADMYGESEAVIGRWLATGGGRREKVVLATKVYSGGHDWPNRFGLSALHIRNAVDRSLQKLQTDHIDLYQFHYIDRHAPWEEIWQAMDLLIRQGKVLYAGSSNFPAWNIVLGHETAKRLGMVGLVADQTKYSLDERIAELEVHPACEVLGIGQLAYGVMGLGLLAGGLFDNSRHSQRATGFLPARAQANQRALRAWEQLCTTVGHSPAEVALAWVLHQPSVTSAIIGPRTTAHLASSLRAVEIALDRDVLSYLDELFPGPGGPAPEAYTAGFPQQPLIED
jgi:aryl-alcohol dehydrogenase-like predicted oxidoreductase